MTLIVGIIIGLALGLLGVLVQVKLGLYAVLGLGIAVVIGAAIMWAQTDVSVGLLVILMVVYSSVIVGARAVLTITR